MLCIGTSSPNYVSYYRIGLRLCFIFDHIKVIHKNFIFFISKFYQLQKGFSHIIIINLSIYLIYPFEWILCTFYFKFIHIWYLYQKKILSLFSNFQFGNIIIHILFYIYIYRCIWNMPTIHTHLLRTVSHISTVFSHKILLKYFFFISF